jgi:hypothetical protein
VEEQVPVVPLVIGTVILAYVGFEVERQRSKLREIFNIIDRKESIIADALEMLVERGELKPYVPGQAI